MASATALVRHSRENGNPIFFKWLLMSWIPAPRFHGGKFIPAKAGTGKTTSYETIKYDDGNMSHERRSALYGWEFADNQKAPLRRLQKRTRNIFAERELRQRVLIVILSILLFSNVRIPEPLPQGPHERSVRLSGDHFQRRVAAFPGKIEHGDEQNAGDQEVRPGIQLPLA